MESRIIFVDEKLVDVVFRINIASLEAAIAATKNRIEGRNRRSRPLALNAVQLMEVKRLLAAGMAQVKIAAMFSVSQATISNIKRSIHNYTVEV